VGAALVVDRGKLRLGKGSNHYEPHFVSSFQLFEIGTNQRGASSDSGSRSNLKGSPGRSKLLAVLEGRAITPAPLHLTSKGLCPAILETLQFCTPCALRSATRPAMVRPKPIKGISIHRRLAAAIMRIAEIRNGRAGPLTDQARGASPNTSCCHR
jgi:hypothetical protein